MAAVAAAEKPTKPKKSWLRPTFAPRAKAPAPKKTLPPSPAAARLRAEAGPSAYQAGSYAPRGERPAAGAGGHLSISEEEAATTMQRLRAGGSQDLGSASRAYEARRSQEKVTGSPSRG